MLVDPVSPQPTRAAASSSDAPTPSTARTPSNDGDAMSASQTLRALPRPSRSVLATLALAVTTAVVAGLLGPMAAVGQDSTAEGDGSSSLGGQGATVTETGQAFPDIVFPVVGPAAYTDTYGACRGSGCSRSHKGADIFAIKLAPLVAAEDGVITGIRRSGLGISGNTIVIESDAGWRYIYVHVNNDAPGTDDGSNPQAWIVANRLRVGSRVSAGDVIGYLGDSGNAENTPSHLHFEVHQPGVGAINPTPVVQASREAGRVISVASLASTAEGRAEHEGTVVAWYQALLKREPTVAELAAWTDRMDIGFADTNDLIADLTMAPARRNPAGDVVRSFAVTLERLPSLNELRRWEDALRNGTDLDQMTGILLSSAPFVERHGELSDRDFVTVIHRVATGAEPSEERMNDSLELLANGGTRAEFAAYWADSYSVKNSTWRGLEVVQAYRAAADRMPTAEEYDQWLSHLNSGGLIPDVVEAIRSAGESGDPEDEDDDPSAEADDETTESGDPEAEADDPSAEADDETTESGDPEAEADDPSAEADDETTESGDPEAQDEGAGSEGKVADPEDQVTDPEDQVTDPEDQVTDPEDQDGVSEGDGTETEDADSEDAETEDPGSEDVDTETEDADSEG